jgi:RNA polymerase-binding protein
VATNAIRGSRVGGGPVRLSENSEPAPRRQFTYWCANGHRVQPSFAAEAHAPTTWECPHCGLPCGLDPADPPAPPRAEPYKSHFAYVKERRSDAEGAALLDEALAELRSRRPR